MMEIYALFPIAGIHSTKRKPKIYLTQKRSWCEELLKEKRKTFYWYMFPFHLVQYANTECHETLRNRSLLKCVKWSVLGK